MNSRVFHSCFELLLLNTVNTYLNVVLAGIFEIQVVGCPQQNFFFVPSILNFVITVSSINRHNQEKRELVVYGYFPLDSQYYE